MDKDGKDLGDFTTSSTFTIQPDGSCTANSCTAKTVGPHTVTATKDGKNGTATLLVTATEPTSDELIDQAVTAGQINADTGLIYKTFAAFGDSRLPAQYHGAPNRTDATGVVTDLQDRYPTLPETLKAVAFPFLIPALYEQSWYFLPTIPGGAAAALPAAPHQAVSPPATICAPGTIEYRLRPDVWDRVQSEVDGVRINVWYDNRGTRLPVAVARADAMTHLAAAVKTVSDLTGIGMLHPLPDKGGQLDDHGDPIPCQGPDTGIDLIDSYVNVSVTHPYPGGLPTAAFVEFKQQQDAAEIQGETAHELTHVLQFGYANKPDSWYWEAMASWAESFVYPDNNTELGHWDSNRIVRSLDDAEGTLPYEAWLMLLYLEKVTGKPAAVVHVWDDLISGSTAVEALDAELHNDIGSGLTEQWRHYAADWWNSPDVDEFTHWDQGGVGAGMADNREATKEDLQGKPYRDVQLSAPFDTHVPGLAATFFRYDITGTGIRGVSFDPTALPKGVTVTVLARRTSDQKWVTPTGQEEGKICTYRPGKTPQRVEFDQLGIVVANGTWNPETDFDASSVTITLHRGCDWPDRITGSSTMTYNYDGDPGFEVGADTEHQVTTVTWEEPYYGVGNQPGEPMDNATYIDGTAKITVHITGTISAHMEEACDYKIDSTISLSGIDYQGDYSFIAF